jgi:hypothetical protein
MNSTRALGTAASLVLFLSLVSACTTQPVAEVVPDSKASFTIIEHGNHSGLTLAKQLVISDAATWASLYTIHKPAARSPPPAINFATEMVIALFIGEQYTGGYAVTIPALERLPDKLLVHFVITTPKPGQPTSMALTQPFVIIKTPRVQLPIVFVQHTTTTP